MDINVKVTIGAEPELVFETPVSAVIDAHDGMGQLVSVKAMNLAIEKAKKTGADLVIGTDPDCDRVGIAVRNGNDFVLFSGNQTGAVLLDFILKNRALPSNPAVVTTIVTSPLGAAIAKKHGCKVFLTLTGFKYIGEKICEWEKSGEYGYVFGYEESYGYLAGSHARDKDAVSSSMLIYLI